MTIKVIPSDNIGWKVVNEGSELPKKYLVKSEALDKAEELAEDVSEIEVYTVTGEKQEYSWSRLKSSYK